jgi:alcohol dehydrogenase
VTQLIESLTSLNAPPFAEALAWSGLAAARDGLLALHADAAKNAAARRCMAWAALASGFALAATGLGAVHGLSSPLGGRTAAPHGMLCATLLAAVTRANLRALETREPSHPALATYARIGALLSGRAPRSGPADRAALVEVLDRWTAALRVPRLAAWGVAAGDLDHIARDARRGSMRTNPIVLTDRELVEVLESRL